MRISLLQRRTVPVLALLALLVASSPLAAPTALAPGDTAPTLAGTTIPDRQRFKADWSEHELTLVNFWATWCIPCRDEMPLLEKLYQENKERGFNIIGPVDPQSIDTVGEYLGEVEVSYTIIKPWGTTSHFWSGIAIKPTSFLIDREGRVLRKYVGARPEQTAGLAADVEAVLDGRELPSQVIPTEPLLPDEFIDKLEQERPAGTR
jgi:thiol-disulfide isomerase/thioredoxin